MSWGMTELMLSMFFFFLLECRTSALQIVKGYQCQCQYTDGSQLEASGAHLTFDLNSPSEYWRSHLDAMGFSYQWLTRPFLCSQLTAPVDFNWTLDPSHCPAADTNSNSGSLRRLEADLRPSKCEQREWTPEGSLLWDHWGNAVRMNLNTKCLHRNKKNSNSTSLWKVTL